MKTHIIYLAAIVVLLLFLFKACNKSPDIQTKETVRVKYIPVDSAVFIFQPQPESEKPPKEGKVEYKTVYLPGKDGRVDTVRMPVDTAAILDYFVQREYWDTGQTKYGPIVVHNSISENKLNTIEIMPHLLIPETTITKTIVKQGNGFYAGFRFMGNQQNYFHGFNLNAALKIRNEIYEAGAWEIQGQMWYEAGVKIQLFGK